jgi:hypothetical protein
MSNLFEIGIVASERNNFSWHFIQSLLNLQKYMGGSAIITHVHSGTIPDGRNAVLDIAKQHNADYALMIDADMTFPSDGAETLMWTMQRMKASIACGIYFGTYPPYASTPMAYDEKDGTQIVLDDWKETRYITSCGMGFTLIDKDLFDLRFEFQPGKGEDHLFCKKARELGHQIILEPKVKCGHLRTIVLDEEVVNKLK